MSDSIELIKLELVSAYEESGEIDIAAWVSRYPLHRMELLDFWTWLKGTPSNQVSESEREYALEPEDIEAYRDSLRDACLAVSFGETMLKAEAGAQLSDVDSLAADLAKCRAQAPRSRDQRRAFRKAVVYTWIVSCLEQNRSRVSRLATQKVSYLLEHAMRLGVFLEHDRKPLGPYDHKSRYRDAEPLATRKGWLKVSGTVLQTSSDLADMLQYVSRYIRSINVAKLFVSHLSRFSDDELETLATVHWTARELRDAKQPITIDTVSGALRSSSDWQSKLGKKHFATPQIGKALLFLEHLKLLETAKK